jgi:methoxymalonate biosynthesis protein
VIKALVWDLDNTLLDGVYLESSGDPPPVRQDSALILAELAGRGILQAIASRNPPEACDYAAQATGFAFAAVQCGWGAKSAAIEAIMSELGLTAGEIAFADDDALERAEVGYRLPDVLVLAPEDLAEAAGWPEFSPADVTDEARRRGELYRARKSRQEEARAFGGSRDDFLRFCQTRVTIGQAGQDDLPRLHELSERTHQFNSAASAWPRAEFERLLTSAEHRLVTVRLADRFGDDGLVGACVIAIAEGRGARHGDGRWQVPLLMMSCRALGRGVIDALLAWLCQSARISGAAEVAVECMLTPRNVPLRIALTGAGFRAGDAAAPPAGIAVVYRRGLAGALPALPDWVITQ